MAANECVKHGAAPMFTIAFLALRPVHLVYKPFPAAGISADNVRG